jgi:catechol 2,3-dioxygenase-like lactoylglutathione lyase family enzyme
MKARISMITLLVGDLERAVAFYRDGLGWATEGIVGQEFEHGAVAFFKLSGGLQLALWPRTSLAHDAGLELVVPTSPSALLAHNVATPQEVGAVLDEVRRAGGRIVKEAQDTFWGGHSGYFMDPDGHLWEVTWNPQLLPEE